MSSVMHSMCDLVSDVLNTYIAYVISACYRISCTLRDAGWIFISVRLPLFLKWKKTTSRCVCINPAWLTNGMDQAELNTLLAPLSLIFVLITMAPSPRGCDHCSHGTFFRWRTFDPNEYKLRRCKRLLRKGPVCLQETKWTGAEIEHLYQQIPGIRVCHSAAVCCGERARTGGVAILLPPGWEMLEEMELVPGRAVAVKVQDRTCQFLLISVYIHPERRKQDAEALLRAWRRLDRANQFVFLTGDFQWY